MPVKYRRLFWPTVLLIAVTSTALALVSVRTRTRAIPMAEREDAAKPAEPPKSSERSIIKVIASSPAFPLIQGDPQNQRIEAELITILPTGFDPTEIRVADGHFRIAVDNKSGLDEVTLRLAREDGTGVREVRLPTGQLKWRERLNLPDGNYLLTEATHANWRCRIIVGS